MGSQYVSYKDYENQWSIQSVASDLLNSGARLYIREGYSDLRDKKQKRGMGIDCIFIPPYEDYEKEAMLKQRNEIACQRYDPNHPYMYQFSPMFAKYPFGREYQNIGEDENLYLDIFPPSFIDENAQVQYSLEK